MNMTAQIIKLVPELTNAELTQAQTLMYNVRHKIIFKKGDKTLDEISIAVNAGKILVALMEEITKRMH